MQNQLIIQALKRQPVDKTPIWIMRQAGRYLPEYKKIRVKAGSFMQLCQTPKLACEVTLQPLRRYDLDAAILFSDILTIPDAMGMGLHFIEGEGPKFNKVLGSVSAINELQIPDVENQLSYVYEAVELIKMQLKQEKPLIGFSGSPFTLACYMIEGGASKQYHKIKSLLYNHPDVLHELLEKLAAAVIAYLNAQIKAGVDVVMLFDSWGGILSTPAYAEFSLQYMKKILSELKPQSNHESVPSIVFTKGGNLWLEQIAEIGCDAIGVDWTIDLSQARNRIGDKVALQGNLDPAILLAKPEVIRQQVKYILQQFGNYPGHIFNLGHGITPDIPPENVAVLVDAVHEFS
ncbi:MAG: uroporphyrinogen decarboxylase [Pseudomonadota bacterium]